MILSQNKKTQLARSKIITFFVFLMPLMLNAAHTGTEEPNIADTLFHHLKNSNELELFPYLPAIPLPFGITVHDLMLLLASIIIVAFFLKAFRKRTLKPKGIAVALESIVLFIRDDIVFPIMGEKRGEVWLPFFSTLFLFIVTINYVGLIPAFKSATGNINVTSALAIMVMLVIFIAGFKAFGIKHFFTNMYPEGVPKPIGIFVAVMEFMGIFIKAGVLSIRLFANMFAGHMVILSLIVMIFLLSPFFTIISIPFAVFSFTLEILIAVIQAFVFTLLSCVFINMAVTSH